MASGPTPVTLCANPRRCGNDHWQQSTKRDPADLPRGIAYRRWLARLNELQSIAFDERVQPIEAAA